MCSAHHPAFSEVLCTVQGIGMLPDHKLIQCRSMPQCMCFWCSKTSLLQGKPNMKRHTLTPLYSDSKNPFHTNLNGGARSAPPNTVGIALSFGGVNLGYRNAPWVM